MKADGLHMFHQSNYCLGLYMQSPFKTISNTNKHLKHSIANTQYLAASQNTNNEKLIREGCTAVPLQNVKNTQRISWLYMKMLTVSLPLTSTTGANSHDGGPVHAISHSTKCGRPVCVQLPHRVTAETIPHPVLDGPKQQRIPGSWGAHGAGYMGLPATTWVPRGAQVSVLSPNDHQNPS
jgi:hypothetical protein